MTVITLILVAAAGAFALSHWLRLPAIPFLVLAGVALTAGGLLERDEMVEQALLLGLHFLVFSAGMELHPSRLGGQRNVALITGFVQFVLMGLVGLGVARIFGLGWIASMYIALAVTASSTIIVVRILMQRRQFFEPFGRLVLGVLLLQDILIVLGISALSGAAMAESSHPAVGIGVNLLWTIALLGLTAIIFKWVAPFLLLRIDLDQESLLLAALSIFFSFIGISYWLGLETIVGAFLAGVALSGFPVHGVVRGQTLSLTNFFLALFFVSLGAMLTMPDTRALMMTGTLILLVVLLTPPLVLLVARRAGISMRNGIEAGLLLAQCSEFSLIVALVGVQSGYLDDSLFAVIALMTVVTMILTPLIATERNSWQLMLWHSTGQRIPPPHDLRDHILLVGCGVNSRVLLDLLLLHGNDVAVIEEDPGIVELLQQRGILAVRGNGADDRILDAAGAKEAAVIISTMRRISDNERLLRHVRGKPVLVRVFEHDEARRIRDLGGTPILEADASADAFLKWYNGQIESGHLRGPE